MPNRSAASPHPAAIRRRTAAMLLLATPLALTARRTSAANGDTDRWAPVRPLLGRWQGSTSGKPGEGSVEREYAFVLGGRFIRESHVSRYPPQPKNPNGEVHEHWSMISFDRAAKALVLRQFHIEGFVNTYRQSSAPGDARLVFDSVAFENLGAGWRARESYEWNGDDAFSETFELAPPDKPFEVYSTNRFRRVR